MPTAAEIERHIADEADIDVLVEEDEGRFVVTGIVSTADEHDRALELARDAAGEAEVEDGLEVLGTMPATLTELVAEDSGFDAVDRDLSEIETRAMDGATEGFEETNLEPGDFGREHHTTTDSWLAQGPTSAVDEDIVSEGDVVFVPPTDPVVARDPVTLRTRVVGGLSPTSMDDIGVPSMGSQATSPSRTRSGANCSKTRPRPTWTRCEWPCLGAWSRYAVGCPSSRTRRTPRR